mmetsp:Transcript_11536/g.30136  ORF Transcript_11536/g.30136 Transcript_11536/m.30136 type:complete len:203 (-) Transcript_11536:859-1467(-)
MHLSPLFSISSHPPLSFHSPGHRSSRVFGNLQVGCAPMAAPGAACWPGRAAPGSSCCGAQSSNALALAVGAGAHTQPPPLHLHQQRWVRSADLAAACGPSLHPRSSSGGLLEQAGIQCSCCSLPSCSQPARPLCRSSATLRLLLQCGQREKSSSHTRSVKCVRSSQWSAASFLSKKAQALVIQKVAPLATRASHTPGPLQSG